MGTTTTPVGTNSASFTTPALTTTTSYWVRVSNVAGAMDSATATVTVTGGNVPDAAEFALIPAGEFQMGDNFAEGWTEERPVHTVNVSAFYMGKYEVTKSLWDSVRTYGMANGYTDLPTGGGKGINYPVVSIDWYALVKWCNARSQQDGLMPCYTVSGAVYKTGKSDAVVCNWNASGYRLPTEAEWEKAARGGLSGKRFPWGDTISHSQANFYAASQYYSYDLSGGNLGYHPSYTAGGFPYLAPVGSFAPNSYSLYDMTGNVSERVWDWHGSDYYGSSPITDPRGTSSSLNRVFRGGEWRSNADGCRVAKRLKVVPGGTSDGTGFRLARSAVLPVELLSITTQPAAATTITSGSTATLTVTATGSAPLSYQWYEGSVGAITTPVGTNSASFTTPALTATTSYWVRVSNAAGAVDSAAATVTVTGGNVPDAAEFALIPAGNFQMGDNFAEGTTEERPVHTVNVSAFYMGKYEVTKQLWDSVRTYGLANGYTDLPVGGGKAANHPVHTISWYDMVTWCNARSEKEGLTPVYTVSGAVMKTGESDSTADWSASGYRLPTEAEWEKAARGGLSGKRFPWGDTISHSQANYYANATGYENVGSNVGYHPTYATGSTPYSSPVGSFAPNGYGLYDMSGNMQERVWDWYGGGYYASSPSADPRGPSTGFNPVVRGGGWRDDANYCRVADRRLDGAGTSYFYVGFRIARGQP